MDKKKLLLKFGLLSIVMCFFSLSYGFSAKIIGINLGTSMKVISKSIITSKMVNIHFADNGNNFGGFFYLSSTGGSLSETNQYFDVNVTGSDTKYVCSQQVEGFYYNAERGERLWPLDQETWSGVNSIKGLKTEGGLYTSCAKDGYAKALDGCKNASDVQACVDGISQEYPADWAYYGSLRQTYSGQQFNLIAGVNYDYNKTNSNNSFVFIKKDSDLSPTFVRLDNKYPVGFIYDYNGGVGLVGCRIDDEANGNKYIKMLVGELLSGKNIAEIFGWNEDDKKVVYRGTNSTLKTKVDCSSISMGDMLLNLVVEGIMGMGDAISGDVRTKFSIMENWSDVKMQAFSTSSVSNATLLNYARKRAEILCRGKWNESNDNIVCLDGSSTTPADNYKNKTLIVKNGDVVVIPNTSGYDIFIDSGNLIINEGGTPRDYADKVFTKDGFISNSSVENFSNEVSRAIGEEGEDLYNGDDVAVGSFIGGNFIVNGKVKGSNSSGTIINKYFVYGKIITKDTVKDLENTFSWRCNNGISNDGNYCPQGRENDWYNPYRNASLVVIDQNYDSPLLK